MALANLPGAFSTLVGIGQNCLNTSNPQMTQTTLDAANEAAIFIGRIITSDGSSHTIDTTGSSSLQWRTDTSTFANAGTTVKVGLAAVDAATGPPARAANAADVITFDVSRSMTGGGGGITSGAWQTHVPTAGTKTIANGDLVAFAVQMTARAGADSVTVRSAAATSNSMSLPSVTGFTGAAYAAVTSLPCAIIVFSDGAIGWFYATDVFSVANNRSFNSGSSPNEYGQLYNFPFSYRVYGIYGWVAAAADCDIVLYSDPLGTPVAEKTVAIDSNTVAAATVRRFSVLFPAPYDVAANASVAAVFKPGGSNITVYYKTLADAAHRVTDSGGTSSYGVSRASGAFANANSSLDHYYIALLIGAFDNGASAGPVGKLISTQRGSPY